MNLTSLDLGIIALYLIATLAVGFWISKRASKNIEGYFLGGKSLPWYYLGLSNASGMFDISGTMWLVYLLFIYGLKSIYIPWLWPTFNQIFLMIFLSIWLRRSGVMTGAEWITFRFGEGRGAKLSHLIVVVFALFSVLGFLAYGFVGIGKFAAAFLPWQLAADPHHNEIAYGLIFTAITTIYVVKGGMFSVVITEVLQFFIMTIASIAIGIIAMMQVSPEMLAAVTPDGWYDVGFGWQLDLDWRGLLDSANQRIVDDGFSLFTVFMMLVLFKGILSSMAGPAPNYDMQRILSARTPVEAAKMSWFVNVVLIVPRYMMITGLAVLALAFFIPDLAAMGDDVDFEQILPFALSNYIPTGLLGIVVAGLLASFMSTFAATTNAAPAYVVNDIYKKYINPKAEDKTYVKVSYIVSLIFVVIGTAIGLFVPSLNDIILWLVSALWGGYTAANMLKWYWWRFNGHGYFIGMLTGMVATVPLAFVDLSPLEGFPILFAASLLGCVIATYLTPAEDMQTLMNFYQKTRPWGFWKPVIEEIQKQQPDFEPNRQFARDMSNVLVGIIWHTSLTATAIFLVIQSWDELFISLGLVAATSIYLKLMWWDRLSNEDSTVPQGQKILATD
ncbi:sodium:solute symporter family protein [Thalassotalea mangrovi]|uniref:Sodium:solute symporter n=1 Tax=Thalassotalea mangrovi TaxID=2572245 RepID=A0A4U1B4R3_9GAMM|nr:sodium:solute symporter family protein [Thalassotalea mangrovi]TKB45299.1 sodium:solute symporter [Thalassotalea mangrovi]